MDDQEIQAVRDENEYFSDLSAAEWHDCENQIKAQRFFDEDVPKLLDALEEADRNNKRIEDSRKRWRESSLRKTSQIEQLRQDLEEEKEAHWEANKSAGAQMAINEQLRQENEQLLGGESENIETITECQKVIEQLHQELEEAQIECKKWQRINERNRQKAEQYRRALVDTEKLKDYFRDKKECLRKQRDEWKERAEVAEKESDMWNTDAVTCHIERDEWKEKAERWEKKYIDVQRRAEHAQAEREQAEEKAERLEKENERLLDKNNRLIKEMGSKVNLDGGSE